MYPIIFDILMPISFFMFELKKKLMKRDAPFRVSVIFNGSAEIFVADQS